MILGFSVDIIYSNISSNWIPAQAQADDSPEAIQAVKKLMTKKYGLLFRIFDFLNRKYKAVDLKITVK